MINTRLLMLLTTSGSLLFSIWSIGAAGYTVDMEYYPLLGYTPTSLSVAKGDSVTWTVTDRFPYSHSSTSGNAPTPNGLWDSGTKTNGQSYTLVTTNLNPGTYPYFCTYDYSLGMVGTLIITNPTIVPPKLTSPIRLPDGEFQFTILGTSGQTYATEASSNLLNWSAITTNVAPANTFNVTDFTATNVLWRFYRARQDL